MWAVLIQFMPVALRIIGWFFQSKEDKAKAKMRFIKFVEERANFAQKSQIIHDEYQRQLEIIEESKKPKTTKELNEEQIRKIEDQ